MFLRKPATFICILIDVFSLSKRKRNKKIKSQVFGIVDSPHRMMDQHSIDGGLFTNSSLLI